MIELALTTLARVWPDPLPGSAAVALRVDSKLHALAARADGDAALCGVAVHHAVCSFEASFPPLMFTSLVPRPGVGAPMLVIRGTVRETAVCSECRRQAWAIEDGASS